MAILLTGATGYIGSHTWCELHREQVDVVGLDNFSNSDSQMILRLEKILKKKPVFYEGDVTDTKLVRKIFKENDIEAVIHFAAFKAVGESAKFPIKYYDNNINGLIKLCQIMAENNVKKIIFSSTATVYGIPTMLPVTEECRLKPESPYAKTKMMSEMILNDLERSDGEWTVGCLRYFNPAGAHESGEIGEDPNGIPNNLMPFVSKVASGELEELSIFGDNYKTKDGTGVRDYIHVVDLAEGHVATLKHILEKSKSITLNLGTGIGYSVFDIVNAFENVSGKKIKYKIAERRAGDIDIYYADPSKAFRELGWKAKRNINQMCLDSWRWQQKKKNEM